MGIVELEIKGSVGKSYVCADGTVVGETVGTIDF
jgi:hypothetical protein